MSRAFIREDIDPPERSGRRRAASGLPPGAANYITARGAACLQHELVRLQAASDNTGRIAELEQILASAEIVHSTDKFSTSVSFGSTVTLSDGDGKSERYTVVGVDELGFTSNAVSWISPLGKALLAADLGDPVVLEDGRSAKIVKIE